jgi:hypothetical protein
MAITRTPMVDDDGTGLTGTIINNAWKQELYNQIDGAINPVAAYGTWQPYSPIWGATASAPAIGDGSLTGRYTLIGKTVSFQIKLMTGAGTSYGSGAWTFTLPFQAFAADNFQAFGPCFLYSVTGVTYSGTTFLDTFLSGGTNKVAAAIAVGANAPRLGPTVPQTWSGAGHWIFLGGTYEMA